MTQNLDVIYTDGAFCPVNGAGITLPEGARVQLTVESISRDPVKDVLNLAAEVYVGFSDADVTDIERIATDR